MPQPTAGRMPTERDILIGSGKARTIPSSTFRNKAVSADHRHGDAGDEVSTALLQKAVASIPSYVERSTIMLVLVPTIAHNDRIGDVCDFRSWRGRGWCRMELLCAFMARTTIKLIVAQGPTATPFMMSPLLYSAAPEMHRLPLRSTRATPA